MKRMLAALGAGALLTLLLSVNTPFISAQTPATLRAYRQSHEAEIINEFADLLAIPNVASDAPNIRRNATKLVEMMQQRGITAHLLDGNGPPAIFGELKAPGATRTVAIYAHYDGQPVDAAKWASPPFTPTLRDKPI